MRKSSPLAVPYASLHVSNLWIYQGMRWRPLKSVKLSFCLIVIIFVILITKTGADFMSNFSGVLHLQFNCVLHKLHLIVQYCER